MKQIGARLSDGVFEQLQQKANGTGTNISDLVRGIIVEHFNKESDKKALEQEFQLVNENIKTLAEGLRTLQKNQITIFNQNQVFEKQVREKLGLAQPQVKTQ